MNNTFIKPQNLPETLVWYYIIGTYGIYYLGAQFVFAPLLGCFLAIYFLKQWWEQPQKLGENTISISLLTWVWIVAVLLIEITLIVGHIDFGLGIGKLVNSSINRWLRTWALFALFPLAGHLTIRPKIIYRAICILCFQSLIATIIAISVGLLHIPEITYISPLKVLGGGELFYTVQVFGSLIEEDARRLNLFAPWAPALGMTGTIYFWLAEQEANNKWRWLGIAGAVAMILTSVSRLAILCIPIVLLIKFLLLKFFNPWVQFLAGLVSLIVGIASTTLINLLHTFEERFNRFRSGSSRVRAVLGRIALERWWNEAPIWGHGTIEPRGPAITGHMPIGTHHTWLSVLFMHGLVGCTILVIALFWSFLDLLMKAPIYKTANVGLSIILTIFIFSFGENIDSLTYMYWPGLLLLGIAFKEEALAHEKAISC
ncbi:MAG TPA: capsular biosynthesis protein [Cyanobacteria bacterium UBA11049]|nr:capsular biosynthesis protein [Cyanobacteria bacterium UBA11049]